VAKEEQYNMEMMESKVWSFVDCIISKEDKEYRYRKEVCITDRHLGITLTWEIVPVNCF
jgi:hypothetical protein